MKELKIALVEKNTSLTLSEDGVVLSQERWLDNNDLLEIFFDKCDAVLAQADAQISEVQAFTCQCDEKSGLTTTRIAQTIMNTLEFASK